MKKAFDPEIPKEWLRTREHMQKTEDKPITKPGLFLRDVQKVISYLDKLEFKKVDNRKERELDDLRKGLIAMLRDMANEVSHKKMEAILKQGLQKEILEKVTDLQDSTLMTMVKNLLNEAYEEQYKKRASIVEMLRKLAAIISQF